MTKINSGRFKKGRKKTGGRKKGTPNKSTVEVRNLFFNLMFYCASSKEFKDNFFKLSPKDQWNAMCKFSRLIPPNFDINDENEKNRASSEKEIIDRLTQLAGGFNGINE